MALQKAINVGAELDIVARSAGIDVAEGRQNSGAWCVAPRNLWN